MTSRSQKKFPFDPQKTIFLIDGSGYIYRAFHAIRGLTNSKGLPTNAVYGFTRMIMKLLEEKISNRMVMFFDSKGPTFRHDMYKDYKANRPPMPEELSVQIPYIHQITRAFNIPTFEAPGYEADDLIGTTTKKAEEKGYFIVIVTGDKDLKQLISHHTLIWDSMKDTTVTLQDIQATGIAPPQLIDVMGLSGDASDNVPGVPGIGPKNALSLIQTFGNMERLYEQVHTITKKKQHDNLIQYKDQALLSRDLVRLNTQAPIHFRVADLTIGDPDTSALADIFRKLEFTQLQQLFPKQADLSGKQYHTIQDIDSLTALVTRLKKARFMAVDTETTSTNPMLAKMVGLSFSIRQDEAFYIPCAHQYLGVPNQIPLAEALAILKPVLEDPAIRKIGQNIKYDWIVFERHGILLKGIAFDTMLASYLINPSKRAHNLDQIALDFLDHKTITYQDLTGKKGKKAVTFDTVPIDKASPYACEDADITLMAYHILNEKMEALGVSKLFQEVEIPLVPVLKDMEMKGVAVDKDKLHDLSNTFEHQLKTIETSIYDIAGESFNINSTQQLGKILFEKLGLPVQKKTRKKTGYSTDVEVLTTLANDHELPKLILRHRTLSKLKSTYADALAGLIHPETGRIHTSFNQTVTATGRLSSSDPNLQNIPIKTLEGKEIRKAFIPKSGWKMLSADYSQIELRILAHYSEDKILSKAFEEQEDIHTRTASEVFQVFPSFITEDLRRQAKIINFGIIYGMSPFGLAKALNISQKMAKAYIDNYFGRYTGVKAFIQKIIEDTRKSGKTTTLLGRIRLLPEINSKNVAERRFAERTAINTPIQGTAADLIKVAMIDVDSELKAQNMKTAMLLSVHDEIVFEVPPQEIDTASALIRDKMESVWDLNVPLKVNIEVGENWAAAH
jgi:DNA polymerase-1